MSILKEIFAHKRAELAASPPRPPLPAITPGEGGAGAARFLDETAQVTPLLDAVPGSRRGAGGEVALIAEIKRASPSRGRLLPPGIEPVTLAGIYQANGAAAVSVLTDERYFQGSLADLQAVHAAYPDLPLLRKDFICDPVQLYEAQAAGASAALLIVAGIEAGAFDRAGLRDLHTLAAALGLAALVEVHTAAELEIALDIGARLVGVNNRNLHTFEVNLQTTFDILPLLPPGVRLVSESGIHTAEDVARLGAAGASAVLVGEAIVTAADIAAKVRELALYGRTPIEPADSHILGRTPCAPTALSTEEPDAPQRSRRPRYCEG